MPASVRVGDLRILHSGAKRNRAKNRIMTNWNWQSTNPFNRLRFAGYTVERRKNPADKDAPETTQARLFLPGHTKFSKTEVTADIILPETVTDTVELRNIPLTRQGDRWVAEETLPLGTQYRIKVNSRPVTDMVETVDRPEGTFNVISPLEADAPRKSGNIADIFLDALVSDLKLKGQLNVSGEAKIRDHFQQYGGDQEGIKALLPLFRKAGFQSILLKPFIGGDDLSSHRYWTKDPFVLNSSFSSKAAFRQTLKEALRNGMTFFADGAFVNQGLNGIQYMANLEHGFRSPYWDWFLHDEPRPLTGQLSYPRLAYEKPSLGILPTLKDPETHTLEPNFARFDFRVLNDPATEGYQADRPTYVQLYDPQMETVSGERQPESPKTRTSEDSVQNYKFKVDPKELAAKRQQSLGLAETARKRIWQEWQGFRLETASHDDSMFKWDGQIDVAKMNMKNPEVRAFLKQAMAYWTWTVKNTYLEGIAQGLTGVSAEAKPQDWLDKLEGLTASSEDFEQKRLPEGKILPPVRFPEVETLFPAEIEATLSTLRPGKNALEMALAQAVVRDFPLPALEVPEEFKSILTIPDLQARLGVARLPVLLRFLAPLGQVGFLKPLVERLKPPSFQERVAETLSQAISGLPETESGKLAYGNVQSLLGDDVAETLYLKLLTGQTSRDRDAVAGGFYRTVPSYIRNADPLTGARLLEGFLKQRLKHGKKELAQALAEEMKTRLPSLSPQALAVAELVADKRELGLNWRIDAAKDVADMDYIREADPQDRAPRFIQEMAFVQSFWREMMRAVRQYSPKAVVIPEWTDFGLLSNTQVENETMKALYTDNTFSSLPNMRYLYGPVHQLVHYAHRPDEFGNNQMTPSGFYEHVIRPMTRNMPVPVQRQYQNLSASHDGLTSSHVMLTNPAIMTMDHLKWWGLKDDLKEISDELPTKACFDAERQALAAAGVADLPGTLNRLKELVHTDVVRNGFSQDVKIYFDEYTKKNNSAWEPTPREMKSRFIDETFSLIPPRALGLTKVAHAALKEQLLVRINEPSETRAMRAVINNAILSLDTVALAGELALNAGEARNLKTQVLLPGLYRALNDVAREEGAHFGYQPLDIALDNLFRHFDKTTVPQGDDFAERLLGAAKTQIRTEAMRPVYAKMLRLFAVQLGLPGNPSIYLPDLFAQGGGELIKNIYVQNRNLIRHDRLETDPELRDFVDSAANLFKIRARYPVFNDGFVVDMPVNDADGVLPIIRDNGGQQGVLLVNTGMPNDIGWDKVGDGQAYKSIRATQPVKRDYKLLLAHLQQPAGTSYIDPESRDRFVVNARGELVSAENPEKGIDIGIYRVLLREE